MLLSDFDYDYPEDLVALYPPEKRDASRLMVLDRKTKTWEHKKFKDILSYFQSGDVLVFNNSKVFPCRLLTQKKTGGKLEVFLVRELSQNIWECLLGDSKKINAGEKFDFGENLRGEILDEYGETRKIRLDYTGNLFDILDSVGHIPLPPYIRRNDDSKLDRERYQTVFANPIGSVAAPTAGFHFTPEIMTVFKNAGVHICFVTLHVGLGTFLPIRTEKILEHKMHGEYYEISEETARVINQAKKDKRLVTVVGTTALRALESSICSDGTVKTGRDFTEKFITPPYEFKVADRLLTNFHQPRSTLLVLISAFTDRQFILDAYREAVRQKYRLFSYGDCMLIE